MVALAGYFAVLLRALALAGLAASVGGLLFSLCVLRPAGRGLGDAVLGVERAVLRVACAGSALLCAALGARLLLGPWALADELGRWPLADYLATGYGRASLVHLLCASAFLLCCAQLARAPAAATRWWLAGAAAVGLLASGALLVHAVSRLEHVATLMTATLVHQLAAAAWGGGVVGLLVCARYRRRGAREAMLWARALARFSPLGAAAVAAALAAGILLATHYVGDWSSLIGTNYGAMILAKLALLAAALSLAALNFLHTRRARRTGAQGDLERCVPAFVEAEIAVIAAVFLLGASLSATPPASDLPGERATPAEVVAALSPKRPVMAPPAYADLLADTASPLDFYTPSTDLDRQQSNFNHNVSGAFVLLIGTLAILDRLKLASWARHWPLLFVPFSVLLALIAQPTGWPLGPEGFWEQMRSPSVLQHRVASLLPLAIGGIEWRVQAGGLAATRWRYVFPALCLVGGGVLLTHSHTLLGTKQEFLIEVSHAAIAVCAILAGLGRWLELRLPHSRVPALLWTASLVAIGLLLLFYRE